jgi:hypothetical protein
LNLDENRWWNFGSRCRWRGARNFEKEEKT